MTSIQATGIATKADFQSSQKVPSGRPAAAAADVADKGKIRLGGAFRLPAKKAG